MAADTATAEGGTAAAPPGGMSRKAKLAALMGVLVVVGVAAAVLAVLLPKDGSKASSSTASSPDKTVSSLFDNTNAQQKKPVLDPVTNIVAEKANTFGTTVPDKQASGAAPPATKPAAGPLSITVPTRFGDKQTVAGGTCYAATWDDIAAAITGQTCGTIVLTAATYAVEEEIVVSRSVTITGDVGTMPFLNNDDDDVPRSFRVLAGVYFQVRYVTMVMAEGIPRPPLPFELATAPMVTECRGGSVLFEDGAAGGTFVGVFFMDDPDPIKGVEDAIKQTEEQTNIRVYGGHIFASSGEIDFIGCTFYDLTIYYPLTNFVQIGGDVLMLAGTLTFTGCVWIEATIFGVEIGAGLFVTNLGGVSIFTACNFNEFNLAVVEIAYGQGWLVNGGVQVATGVAIDEFSGVIGYIGTGELCVGAGVNILTGIGNEEAFAIGVEFGVGLEYTYGSGVGVHTGSSMIEWNGIFAMGGAGELAFLGTGVMISTGSPSQEYLSILDENGQGGVTFNGAGYTHWESSPIFDLACYGAAYMTGEYITVDSGFLVVTECVFWETAVMEAASGIGSLTFIADGAMVIANTPLIEWYGPLVQQSIEFYVMGTCENEGESEDTRRLGGGTGADYVHQATEKHLARLTDEQVRKLGTTREELSEVNERNHRAAYNLPIFVAPLQGCSKYGVAWTEAEESAPTDATTLCAEACGCDDDGGSAPLRRLGAAVHRETEGEVPGEGLEGCSDCPSFCITTWRDYKVLQSKIACAKACTCAPYDERRLGAAVHREIEDEPVGEVPADCDTTKCFDFCTGEWLLYKDKVPAVEEPEGGDPAGRRRQVLAVDELWEDEDVEEWDEPELLDEPVRRQLPVELPQGGQAKRRYLQEVFGNGGPTGHLPHQVRRAATNMYGADRHRHLQGNKQQNIGLVAANVPRYSNVDGSMQEFIAATFPESTLRLWDSVRARLDSLRPNGPRALESSDPAFFIESDVAGYCGLCNVPDAVGLGARSCDQYETCAEMDVAAEGLKIRGTYDENAERRSLIEISQTQPPKNTTYDEHHILVLSIEATAHDDSTVKAVNVQEALVAAIAHLQGGAHDKDAVIVNMWKDEINPLFNGMKAQAGPSPFATAQHNQTFRAKAGILMTSETTKDLVLKALNGETPDGHYDDLMVAGTRVAYTELTGVDLDHLELNVEKTLFVPAYNSKKMRDTRHRHLGSLSTLVLDPEQLSHPVTHIKFNKNYHIYLDNWPANTKLDMRLVKLQEDGEEDLTNIPLEHFTTDEHGSLKMDFTFEHRHLEAGEYYLQAVLPTGEVGMSQSYVLSHAPQRRRLYGPEMML